MNRKLIFKIQVVLLLFLSQLYSQQLNKTKSSWQSINLPSGQVAHLGTPETIVQQSASKTTKRQINLAFILDASGSMNAELPGSGSKKLAIAKQVLGKIFPKIPSDVKGALWVYGHRYPQKPRNKSCLDIENIFPLEFIDAKAYTQKMNSITAIGYTPIAESIKCAANTFVANEDQYNSIILISDGEETCGGDPCNIAEKLKSGKTAVTIHVIGYDVNEKTREQLNCIAQASGGIYFDARDAEGLLRSIKKVIEATISETILKVEINRPNGEQEGEDISIFQSGTNMKKKIGRYLCWKDIAVPPGNYDLVIESLPWILHKNISIEENTTTVVKLSLGKILVKSPDQKAADFHLYDTETKKRLGFYNNEVLLAPGFYYLNVQNIDTNPIFVKPGEITEIILGSIRAVSPKGNAESVTLFQADGKRLGRYGNDIVVVPGKYQVAINNSKSEDIYIGNGEKKEIKLSIVRVLDTEGKTESVTVFDGKEKRLGFYGNDILLVPGNYYISVNNKKSELLKLSGGEQIEIKLGAINLKQRFEIYDDLGKRLGSYESKLPLLPGSYSLKTKDSTFDNVKVTAGKITDLN
jgi:hypothetical protein